MDFKLVTNHKPAGSQPPAIDKLVNGLRRGMKHQTLLGVTGSGKTFTMANVISKVNRKTLVLAPNKTLAAQLYSEFKELFPENAVEYFVSYYDYYQPEAYLPASDTYIDKDADINAEIEKLKHRTTSSLLDREDVLVVATVSAIYGLGSPVEYMRGTKCLTVGEKIGRNELIKSLVDMHYERTNSTPTEGEFRVRGQVFDIFPPYSEKIIRVKADDSVDFIQEINSVTREKSATMEKVRIYPAVHYLLPEETKEDAITEIRKELKDRLKKIESEGKLVEAARLKQRTEYDLELIEELGYCKGIENYSRHLENRKPGEPPNTLLDFFPDDWLCFIDESHIGVPQIRGMHEGDKSRKETLVRYGFRLPSALDNRPLRWDEFESKLKQVIYVSATPANYELKVSNQVVEQIIRPTGLVDPEVEVRPAKDQVADFMDELDIRVKAGQRVLATTLTKRMSEDLAEYIDKKGYKVKYLHSDIDTLERIDILRQLRLGEIDVVVGVNLLREGLDLPEVSLVAMFDADQEGFLRSTTSLIQTIGRCSRNIEGRVILYADKVTTSMRKALDETKRRRDIQVEYNTWHGITPTSIRKKIHDRIVSEKPKDMKKRMEYSLL
ncbi:MAG: excinuclease ABC subunit UvrB, partial [Candidatus Altiarchaeota archaeon]|nr:excinuclease ABC subunit UvrB [Candidatus Altiarchaeota archaeon]